MVDKKEQSTKSTSKTNHFNVTISKSRNDLYEKVKALSNDLGCTIGDLCWYGLELVLKNENKPTKFGLSK